MRTYDIIAARPYGNLHQMLPARKLADRLVQAYLCTFQTVLGILDVPIFRQRYNTLWSDAGSMNEEFVASLLLVMSIGAAFCSIETTIPRQTVLQWIHAVTLWLDSPASNAKRSLDGLRVQCLLHLAHQVRSSKCNDDRYSTGALLRLAMTLGLHIDSDIHPGPRRYPAEVESRRRLWATTMELEIQFSIDCGSVPTIGDNDYSCQLPLNIDDASLQAGSASTPKSMEHLTQSCIQILLMESMPVRLKIARFTNSFQSSDSFEEALRLSEELSAAFKSSAALIESYRMSSNPPTSFQTKMFDLLVHRFFIALHHPFTLKSLSNLSYYYSRKMCLETALSLLSPSGYSEDDEFHRPCVHGAGPLRNIHRQSAVFICRELIETLETERPLSAESGRNEQEWVSPATPIAPSLEAYAHRLSWLLVFDVC